MFPILVVAKDKENLVQPRQCCSYKTQERPQKTEGSNLELQLGGTGRTLPLTLQPALESQHHNPDSSGLVRAHPVLTLLPLNSQLLLDNRCLTYQTAF